jgi:hypothetical protein
MPKQLTFTAYSYDELPENAKEKTLEKLYDINVEFDDWHELILDMWKDKLEAMGFEDVTISYTGFWSQGDGASFICKRFNILTWLKYNKACKKYRSVYGQLTGKNPPHVSGHITRYGHYYHERSTMFDLEVHEYTGNLKSQNQFYGQIDELTNWTKDEIIALNRQIYRDLEEEYSFQTSRETVEDTIHANEYLFFADGNLISHPTVMAEVEEIAKAAI